MSVIKGMVNLIFAQCGPMLVFIVALICSFRRNVNKSVFCFFLFLVVNSVDSVL